MDQENRYPATCCVCQHHFEAAKSIAQRAFNMPEAGHGACPKCGTFLNLTFNEAEQRMDTKSWEDWAEARTNERRAPGRWTQK